MISIKKHTFRTLFTAALFLFTFNAVAADSATTRVDRPVPMQGVAALLGDETAIYTNMPWSGGGGPCIGENGLRATGVALQTPAGDPTAVGTVVIDMHDVDAASNFDVRLYSDSAGFWDVELAAFPIMSGPGGGAAARGAGTGWHR